MKLIIFDTEATGLEQAQICQLATLAIENGTITGKNRFFAVDGMAEAAQRIHGLSIEALNCLSGGVRFADRAEEILTEFTSADLIAGHNVSSDVRYLKQEFTRLGLSFAPKKAFCTMNAFTRVTRLPRKYGGGPKPPRLEELTAHYGLTPGYIAERADSWFGGGLRAHDARYDAAATLLSLIAAIRAGDAGAEVVPFFKEILT